MKTSKENEPPDFWPTVIRTALGRCPNCGKGRLFASYLKPVACCAVCGEALGHIRADDCSAWLAILLMGLILAPLLVGIVPHLLWPNWAIMSLAITLTLVLTLAILPRVKGFFIGAIWRSECIGSEK